MSILPLPELPSENLPSASEAPAPTLHLTSLEAYSGRPNDLIGAGFWIRSAARLIDLVTHYAIALCSGLFMGFVIGLVATLQHSHQAAALLRKPGSGPALFIFSLLGSTLLETVCETFHGSTPGKFAFGLVVVQEDGTPCRFQSALIRSFAYYIDALFFGLIAYFAMQKTPMEQRHGDEWAHTVVCNRSQVQPQNLRGFGQFAGVVLLAAMVDSALIITGMMIHYLG